MFIKLATLKSKIVGYLWSYNPSEPAQKRSYWRHFLQIVILVGRDLMSGILNLRSMSLVYTTLLAFIPMLAVSMWVLKRLGVHEQIEPGLTSLLAPLGDRSAEFSSRVVEFVENMEIGLLGLLGLSMLIYTAISLMRKIESSFNHTWRLQKKRSWLQRIIVYLGLLAVGPALVFSALAVTASLASNSMTLAISDLPFLGDMVEVFGKFLPYILVTGAFTLIYFTVPNTRVRPASALYGGLLAGVIWQSTGILFATFVAGSTSYTVIYSGFAIIMLLMVWVHLSWLILLVGASIAYYHQHPESLIWPNSDVALGARMRDQAALQVMLDISQSHHRQSNVRTSIEYLAKKQRVPVETLRPILEVLEANNLVRRAEDNLSSYLPAGSVESLRLIDILRGSRGVAATELSSYYHCDASISKLLDKIDSSYESKLGELTLTDLMKAEDDYDENSLV